MPQPRADDGASISSGAGALTAAATRIASELKTLDTYLTTTPTTQLDPGYIASQSAYLDRQLTRLQGDAGSLGSSVTSLEAGLRTLSRDARALRDPLSPTSPHRCSSFSGTLSQV